MKKAGKPDLNPNILTVKKLRNTWGGVKPFLRVKDSAKVYNRKKVKKQTEE